MITFGLAFLQAKYAFDPGFLYVAGFVLDIFIIEGIFRK